MEVVNNIDINSISAHIAAKRRQVTDAQLELKLLEEERVRVVNSMCLDPIHYYIDGAMAWLKMCNNDKVDKRKKCDEKDAYNVVVQRLNMITKHKVKEVTEIAPMGWGRYRVNVTFVLSDDDSTLWRIVFPAYGQYTTENLESGYMGQYALLKTPITEMHITSWHWDWDAVVISYNIDDITNWFGESYPGGDI